MNNFNNVEVENEETKVERFLGKAKAGVKKYGKPIAKVMAVGAVGLISYKLGTKSKSLDSDVTNDIVEDVIDEVTELKF